MMFQNHVYQLTVDYITLSLKYIPEVEGNIYFSHNISSSEYDPVYPVGN